MAVSTLIFSLLTDPAITNLESRVFPLVIPDSERNQYSDTECAVTYQVIDGMPNADKHRASKVDNTRIQLSCHGEKYSICEAVMASIRSRIDHKRDFVIDGTSVQVVYFIDQRDLFDKAGNVVGLMHDYTLRIER